MRQLLALAFAAAFALPALAQNSAAAVESGATKAGGGASAIAVLNAADASLDEFLWTHRPVIVFADTEADPRFREQLDLLLARSEELLARDVVLIIDADPAARSDIRTRFRPRGFMLTLIAKDGRVNLRKPFPWDVREITHAIDKWPIRQKEIRDRKSEAAER